MARGRVSAKRQRHARSVGLNLATFNVNNVANDPVPLFPYPGSPDYRKLWGEPDEWAWERAHDHYLKLFDQFSDVQEARPRSLQELELEAAL